MTSPNGLPKTIGSLRSAQKYNIMRGVKFLVEKMLGVPVAQVNVNVQGLSHSAAQTSAPKSAKDEKRNIRN